jgi:xylulokinase
VHAATVGYGDATSYLVAKATGRLAIDPTAAGGTGMLDLKRRRWSRIVAKLVGFPLRKMPELVASSAVAGTVHSRAAQELGVPVGTPVAMGMADIPAAAVGSGAVRPGAAHLYIGTSSWVGVCIPRPISLPAAGIATAPSAQDQGCLLIAESETAGACRDWIGAQLGLDTPEELAAQVPPGSDGLLFCPWMYGERSPVPDPLVRGAFVNLSLAHGRAHMARAVLEGVALNTAWVLGAIDRTGCRSPSLRAIGGGAKSDLWMQIMADATGESVVRMAAPQLSGAVGAGLMAAVAVGDLACVEDIADRVVPERTFTPDPTVSAVMERQLAIMQQIAPALSRAGRP